VGLYLVLAAGLLAHLRPSSQVKRLAPLVWTVLFAQMALGAVNMLLLAPVALQLAHLLVADILWIVLLLQGAEACAEGVPQVEIAHARREEQPLGGATWRDYIALTKPRVISLLLFTTLAAMFIAQGGMPDPLVLLAVALGGYMAAGSANAINMVVERDLDGRMDRTAGRPTVTQKIPSRDALLFAFALAGVSFAALWAFANMLAAMLALAGLVCYVIVYTIFLKRRSWTNIVIGGAAGAFPPLVGWASVTGDLSLLAWCLFAIIFVWTPVHFWALALILKDDYAKAGVPMLPVVMGDRATIVQIAWYAAVTIVLSAMPAVMGQTGSLYLWAAALLNIVLVERCLQLYLKRDRPRAGSLFKYSMLYLALLFLAMAVDRSVLA
jgi:protoheme IX farnesyltransferase